MAIGSLWMSIFLGISFYIKINVLRKKVENASLIYKKLDLIFDEQQQITDGTKSKIDEAISYINENYSRDISREGLASSLEISPNHLGKYFKIYTNKSINDYINYLRIMDSTEKLRNSDDTIVKNCSIGWL